MHASAGPLAASISRERQLRQQVSLLQLPAGAGGRSRRLHADAVEAQCVAAGDRGGLPGREAQGLGGARAGQGGEGRQLQLHARVFAKQKDLKSRKDRGVDCGGVRGEGFIRTCGAAVV